MSSDGDPRFNGGQQLREHDGGVRRLILDEQAEHELSPHLGAGTPSPLPPPGTVGADQAAATAIGDELAAVEADAPGGPSGAL